MYHIVWWTRWRRKYIKDYVKTELLESFYKVVKRFPEIYIQIVNTDNDHVHIQIEIPPNVTVAKVVQELKKESSKHLKKKFKFINKMFLDWRIWSVWYFSSTNWLNDEVVRKYIEHQNNKENPSQLSFELE